MPSKEAPKVQMASQSDDPLTRAMAPPPNETPAEREVRLQAERKAKQVSDAIDEELKKDQRKSHKLVKILLLGGSLYIPTTLYWL